MNEIMAVMATYYKPSQWRGKRLVYRSIDPDEPKQEMRKVIRFLVGGVVFFVIIWLAR
jgi:hypothetical protein